MLEGLFGRGKNKSQDAQPNKKKPDERASKPAHKNNTQRTNHQARKPDTRKPVRNNTHRRPQRQHTSAHRGKKTLRIVPLGGLEEVGRNMMMFEYGDDIMIIDAGLQFPEADMLGVDYVLPNVSYLEKNKHKIRGMIITHGHLDHIGGIPHILPKIGNPPIYGLRLTMGLIENRLREFGLNRSARLHTMKDDSKMKLGVFECEFFRVNHSIPDCAGVHIKTPVGNIVHTGDFKFDFNPVGTDQPADLSQIARYGGEGVLALFADSTNASKPGKTLSENEIGANLEELIKNAQGRIIIASFSTLLSRVAQVIKSAIKHKRKIFVSGRSMVNNIDIAQKLGYINVPKGTITKLGRGIKNYKDHQVLVLTTGSQGETLSALTRMAFGEHPHLDIKKGDTVVFSSTPIPGNENSIVNVINNLCIKQARVVTNDHMDIHTSGHAHQEDLKLMYQLVKPKYLIPVHGMMYMRTSHKQLAMDNGFEEHQIHLVDNGDILEATPGRVVKSRQKIPAPPVIVDGLGVGDLGTRVMQERKTMSNSGVVVLTFKVQGKDRTLVGKPGVATRGFVYMDESKEILEKASAYALEVYNKITQKEKVINNVKVKVAMELSQFFHKRLGREPLVMPLIIPT
jgi:ribonuclease J